MVLSPPRTTQNNYLANNMSTRMSTRGEGGGGGITKKISAMSCILFQQHNDKYGHPNHHDQCSNCDLYLAESPFWSGKTKKNMKPPHFVDAIYVFAFNQATKNGCRFLILMCLKILQIENRQIENR